MELAELATYADEKYHIREEHKWAEFPGFSVLCEPVTGKWLALLMRQWDSDLGTEIEVCDIKCGPLESALLSRPFLAQPFRMRGPKWVGVRFGKQTETATVCDLFDTALASEKGLLTLAQNRGTAQMVRSYAETPLPAWSAQTAWTDTALPEKIREMRKLETEPPTGDIWRKYKLFCIQGKFMEDYEDNAPWNGVYHHYYPSYRDLTNSQLRGFFTWRTWVRHGEYRRTPNAFAYLYIYELLNGFGVSSPKESFQRLQEFKAGYLDAGFGDKIMESHLSRWMMEYSVVQNLPAEVTKRYLPPWIQETDQALVALMKPDSRTDEELYAALLFFAQEKLSASIVVTQHGERGKALFAKSWREAIALSSREAPEKSVFNGCFGPQCRFKWKPLFNAFCFSVYRLEKLDYALNEVHSFQCRNGSWEELKYPGLSYQDSRFFGFLHETDRRLRQYLKTGHALRKKPDEAWATPFVDAAIRADQRAVAEAAKPKIDIDLSGLEQIRQEALITQNSLLTDEEKLAPSQTDERTSPAPPAIKLIQVAQSMPAEEAETPPCPATAPAPVRITSGPSASPLDSLHTQILQLLLHGDSPAGLMQSHRMMPSIVADLINEALFDEIGDNAIDNTDDILSLVEDYREDVARIVGEHL